jgi:Na+-driven multidrug efflux pump
VVKGEVKTARNTAIIANAIIFGFGVVLGLLLYFFSESVANVLIDDPVTRKILASTQRLYAPLIPIELMQGSIYAVVRGINKQNQMIYLQIFANYIFHFLILINLLSCTDLTNYAIVYACGATY